MIRVFLRTQDRKSDFFVTIFAKNMISSKKIEMEQKTMLFDPMRIRFFS